jgi:hypothetical protein
MSICHGDLRRPIIHQAGKALDVPRDFYRGCVRGVVADASSIPQGREYRLA